MLLSIESQRVRHDVAIKQQQQQQQKTFNQVQSKSLPLKNFIKIKNIDLEIEN